ncbi:hypothetical protein JL722_1413 [Aureococcus anophagefferens]|nr:hypothetical protein JL722_1413 [Aureococcus anophagefferens]
MASQLKDLKAELDRMKQSGATRAKKAHAPGDVRRPGGESVGALGTIYTKWEQVEAFLATKMCAVLSKKMGAEEVHVQCAGAFRGFVTMPGLASVPCFELNSFKAGFDTRMIDTMKVSNNDYLAAFEKKEKAAKTAKMQKKRKAELEWMLKWSKDEDKPGLEKAYAQYNAEVDAEEAEEHVSVMDTLKAGGTEALREKIKAKIAKKKEESEMKKMSKASKKVADGEKMAVGKMTITDCHLSIKGTKFRLDKDYVVRAFRGTMGELKNHCKEKVMAHRQEKFEAKKEYVQEKKQQAKDFVAERVELRKTQLKSMFGSKKADEPAAN